MAKKAESLVVTDLQVEMGSFATQMKQARKLIAGVDSDLGSLTQSANKAAKALNKLAAKKVDVTIAADSSSLDRVGGDLNAIDGRTPNVVIQADTTQIDGVVSDLNVIDGATPSLTVQADGTQIDGVMSDIDTIDGATPDVTIHASTADLGVAMRIISSMDSAAPTVRVNTDDSEVDTTKTKVDGFNTTETVKITADTSSFDTGLIEVGKKLDDLKDQGKLQIALDLIPVAGGAVGGAADFIKSSFVDPLIEVDRALGAIKARTGQVIPDADKLISDIFGSNMAESRTEVAEWIAQFAQVQGVTENMSADIIGVATASDVMGTDFGENLRAVDKLVSSGLVGSVQEANDLLVTAFQQGGNRADDLIDTLVEYPLLFKEMGVGGAGAVDLMLQALEAGSFNTDKLADTFKELGIRVDEAIGSGAGATFDALKVFNQAGVKIDLASVIDTSRVQQLIDDGLIKDGILNPMQLAKLVAAGEISGVEFADGMTGAVNKAVDDGLVTEGAATFNLREIFGTPLEDLGTDLFRGLDFGKALAATIDTGATDEAGAALYGSLDQTLNQTGRLIQENLLDKMGGMEGILDKINEKAKELNALLQSGTDIPEALEIILEAPGLADTLHGFEGALGNFVIDLLSGVADILEGLNQGQAATNVRREVGRLSEQQLAFDLQFADTENEVVDAVQRAIGRGVDAAAADGAVSTAIEEMLAKGNVGAAAALVKTIEDVPPATIPVTYVTGEGTQTIELPVDVEKGAFQEDIDKAIDDALAAWMTETGHDLSFGGGTGELRFNPQVDVSDLDAQVQAAVTALTDQARTAMASGDKLSAIDLFEQAGATSSAKEVAETLVEQFQTDYIAAMQSGDFTGDLLETFQTLQDYDIDPFFVGFELDEATIRENLRTQFDALLADPTTVNLDLAEQIATQLEDTGMKEHLEEVTAQTADTRAATDLLTGAWDDLTGALSDVLPGFTDLESQGIDPTVDALGLLADDTTSYGEDLAGMLAIALVSWTDYVDRVNALKLIPPTGVAPSAGGTTPGVVTTQDSGNTSGAGTNTEGFDGGASGGKFKGTFWTGEEGPELVSSDVPLDVLNNVSSSALMAGVQAALSGGSGGGTTVYNDNRSIYLNMTNNNQSGAQRMGSDIRFLNRVRGSV